jgi:hypothetical protein
VGAVLGSEVADSVGVRAGGGVAVAVGKDVTVGVTEGVAARVVQADSSQTSKKSDNEIVRIWGFLF